MEQRVKQECIELIETCTDFELVDLIWRLLLKSADREMSPENTTERKGLRKWQKQKQSNQQKKN